MSIKKLDDWKILRTAKWSSFFLIAGIAAVFLAVIAFNVKLIFEMTSNQTEENGQMQLERIRSELQSELTDTERILMRVALNAEQMLASGASHETIKKFFEREQREQKILSNGECFNVYIANKDWAIIPTFEMPESYHAAERLWYRGAVENPDSIYITEPYIDAMTGEMCFTLSTLLSDKQTVVALDFTFASARESVIKMNSGSNRTALIVTKSGKIIGHKDMSLVGKKISNKLLPEYMPILERVVNSTNPHESFREDLDGRSNVIFSSETKNGWYLILSVDTSELYHEDYFQLLITSAVSLVMVVVIVFLYLKSMKNRLQAIKALRAKEEFLSNLSRELRAPLDRILRYSNVGALGGDVSPAESASRVRESAVQLSDMLDNLFSFSTLLTEREQKSASVEKTEKLSDYSRRARRNIIFVLTIALFFRLGISIDTTMGWGDTKMNREVENYEQRLSGWVIEQKGILGMFVNILSEHPEFMDDYPSAVEFLDGLAKKYPDISACYMANPYKKHQVIMNNGWESSDPNWQVDKRQWYIDTEKSADGFNVSAPYYDARTGLYCVTLSQMVYGKNGEFIGIFGIDFYIDRLIQILSERYTGHGYAFIVDSNGIIINHPHFSYQLAAKKMTNINETEYREVYADGEDFLLQDFRGDFMTSVAKKDALSKFTVVVVNRWQNIYGQVLFFGILFVVIYAACAGLVVVLINRLLKWQAEVQQKLTTAVDTALAAGQAKTQFLARMSHEIRTPINAVLGMNEMILRESTDKDIREYAENISSAGRTLLNLINSILDFSKIEDGKMEIIPVRYETLNLVDDLVNMIHERAYKKNLSFVTKIESTLPRILFGDDMRIKQVIINLLTNAVKYTEKGTVTLTMQGRAVDAETLELFVSVTDTGIGIREEDLDKLYLSFSRLDEEKNKNIEGTGLGISIVRELLKMMNSHLEIKSVYGEGSDFSFKIRQKIIDKTQIGKYGERHAERSVKHELETNFIKAPSAKILAVDDMAMNLKVIKGLLKRNEIIPDLADSGKKCLELAAKKFYHIIFLDHMMPEMDGVETLKHLKEMNLPVETKIVVLTANAITGAREKYISQGFDDYLSKPIEIAALEAIISKYIPSELLEVIDMAAHEQEEEVGAARDAGGAHTDGGGDDEFSAKERAGLSEVCPQIDLNTGLTNCMDSKEFYIEMVKEFLAGDRSDELNKAVDSEDWQTYRIAVHALKSTSLVIGAVEFSGLAKLQEFSARDGNIEMLKEKHTAFMQKYQELRASLSKWLED